MAREVDSLRKDVEARARGGGHRRAHRRGQPGRFDAELARLVELAAAGGDGFALLMADLDHFKAINDAATGTRSGPRRSSAFVGSAARVIDCLEVVQVGHEQREASPPAAGQLDQGGQLGVEGGPLARR